MAAISLVDFVALTTDQRKSALVQKITNESAFLRVLRFVQVDGFTYTYSEQATLGGIAFRALNESYTADVGVVNPKVETLGIFGGLVQSDYQMVNKQGGIVRANAIMAKTRKAGLFFDKYVIDGDPANDAKQFYGLNARLTGSQVISAGTNGAALTTDMVDDLIDRVVGLPSQKVLVMNKADRRALKKLVLAAAGGAGVADFASQPIQTYDGVRIEVIDEDGDEAPILGKDEAQGTSAVTSSIYCMRPGSDVEGEYLQGLVGSKLIETYPSGMQGTTYVDVVEANMGIAVFHGRSAARLKGVL